MRQKRLLSWLLTFAMIAGMFVVPASADDTTTISGDGTSDQTGQMTITLKIKETPTASDFTFTAPASLAYDGQSKTATVTSGKTGMGEITVEYYEGETKLDSAPSAEGTYTVKANVAEGTEYKAATVEDSSWAFTITPLSKSMTITLVIKERAATPAAPTVTQTTATTITVNTVSGCEYVLLPSGTELTNTHWEQSYQHTGSDPTHTFSELTPGTAYTVYARVRDTDELRASEPASTSTATLPAAPSASIGLSLIDYVNEQFKSSFVLDGITYEISPKSGTDFEGSKVSAGAKVNPDGDTTARTYYIRTAAVTRPVAIPASETTAFIIPERPSRPDVKLFTAVNATGDATTDGKILGVNDKMAYATTESGAYTSITANATELTGLSKGSYYLRYIAVDGKAFSSKASDALTVGSNAINLTAVSIVGNAKYGETLTATITPANATGTITYAWYRGDAQIGTGSTYTLTAADIVSTITVKATQDGKTTVESAATAIVTPAEGSRTKPRRRTSSRQRTRFRL